MSQNEVLMTQFISSSLLEHVCMKNGTHKVTVLYSVPNEDTYPFYLKLNRKIIHIKSFSLNSMNISETFRHPKLIRYQDISRFIKELDKITKVELEKTLQTSNSMLSIHKTRVGTIAPVDQKYWFLGDSGIYGKKDQFFVHDDKLFEFTKDSIFNHKSNNLENVRIVGEKYNDRFKELTKRPTGITEDFERNRLLQKT